MRDTRTPVTIVTGALGAGKTTLVNRLLERAGDRRVAVLENEFGDVGIDGALIRAGVPVIEVVDGCLCCSRNDRLIEALERLALDDERLDWLLVETTGVADPMPVLQAFQAAGVRGAFSVRKLVTVVDLRNGLHDLARFPEWRRQVRLAGTVALSKSSVARPRTASEVQAAVRELNGVADMDRSETIGDALVGLQDASPSDPLPDRASGAANGAAQSGETANGDGHGSAHGLTAVAVTVPGSLDPMRLESWLAAVCAAGGQELVRIKGVIALAGEPRRYVIQGVRALLDGQLGEPWGGPRESRLVFIGSRLDRDALTAGLDACKATPTKGPA